MRVHPDDEVYRVNSVWLGPPKALMPFRARYVAWGIGMATFLVLFGLARGFGFGFNFFTVMWTMVLTVVVTRVVGRLINHERPLGTVLSMAFYELTGPRRRTRVDSGVVGTATVAVRPRRPRPRSATHDRPRPARRRP